MDSEEAKFKAVRSCRYPDLRISLTTNLDALHLILNKRLAAEEHAAESERLRHTESILKGLGILRYKKK